MAETRDAAPTEPKTRQESIDYAEGIGYAWGRMDSIRNLGGRLGDFSAYEFATAYMQARWACRAGLTGHCPSVQEFWKTWLRG